MFFCLIVFSLVTGWDCCSVRSCLPSVCFRAGVFFDKGLLSLATTSQYLVWNALLIFILSPNLSPDAVKSCWSRCCSWRTTSNSCIHVPVWHNCFGTILRFSYYVKHQFKHFSSGFLRNRKFWFKGIRSLTVFQLLQLCGAKLSEGIFVGCFLSMSSTAVVFFLSISVAICVFFSYLPQSVHWITFLRFPFDRLWSFW